MRYGVWGAILCALLVLAPGVVGDQGSIFTGGGTTESKPQSKFWYADGFWWAVLLDGANHHIHRMEGGTLVPIAFVDSRNSAQADVLWNGTDLIVLMGHSSDPRLYKYSYDAGTNVYSIVSGFPVSLPIPGGGGDATIAQDTTGKLWVTYVDVIDNPDPLLPPDGALRVTWSTSADHTSWDATGHTLDSNVEPGDISTIVAYSGRVGIFWSNQIADHFAFASHEDGDPETTWDPIEIVDDSSQIADDHINAATTPAGGILVATKDRQNDINLFYRSPGGGWEGPYLVDEPGTRPAVVYDEDNDEVYVLYTDWGESPDVISFKRTALSSISVIDTAQQQQFIGVAGLDVNDFTSTKDTLRTVTGLVGGAKAGSDVHFNCISLGAAAPTALATLDVSSGATPLTVNFTGSGTDDGSIVSYSWNFGDGTSSTAQNPSHTYTVPGTYNGNLVVTDDDGLTGADLFTINVTPPSLDETVKINFQPSAAIVPAGYTADSGEEFNGTFGWTDDMSSRERETNPDQRKDTYVYESNSGTEDWEYLLANGDYLVTVVAGSPLRTGVHYVELEGEVVINAVATSGGEFVEVLDHPVTVADGRLTMTVSGEIGGSKKTKVCYIEIRPDDGSGPPGIPPTATATLSTTSGDLPLTVDFTGTGTDDIQVVSYFWEFGDGSTSTEQNPSYIYTSAGTFNGRLIVTDNEGLMAEDLFTVTVTDPGPPGDPPTATASPSTTSGVAPLVVDFTGSATDDGTIVSWFWEFGDGNTSTEQSPQHTYTGPGTFNGRLVVTDDDGRTGEDLFAITVTQLPVPTATPSVTSGDTPLTVDFTGSATDDGTIVTWFWEFGDGSTSAEQSPSYTYTTAGTFNGKLTVTDNDGLQAEDTFTITTTDPPPPPPPGDTRRINFQPLASVVPTDYEPDGAEEYTVARGYGWDDSPVHPKERGVNADQRLDTYVYVRNSKDPALWQLDLANGDYLVTVVMGSPLHSGNHFLDIEGVTLLAGVSTSGGEFVTVTDHAVTITDGALNLAIGGPGGGSKKSKICYLIVTPAGP